MSIHKEIKRITTHTLQEMKNTGRKITMLTGYDFSMARIIDSAGIDVILVGDSVGTTLLGYDTTIPVTIDDMVHHTSAVRRGQPGCLVVADLPFGEASLSFDRLLDSSRRLMQNGADAVKIEGGKDVADDIEKLVATGIPVMGHLGLTPQSIYKFGTYTVRAKEDKEASQLIEDAKMLEKIGCFAIVLEKIPAALAQRVAQSVNIPIIGIGAGNGVDGQVLVLHDMIGMTHEFNPRFLRRYMNLYEDMSKAISQYVTDVKKMDFPSDSEQY